MPAAISRMADPARSRLFRRLAILVVAVLLVPIVPFLLFQDRVEPAVESWLHATRDPATIALAVVSLLTVDLLLPIPSSLISTYAGAQLGILPAALASWLGMTLGAAIGFFFARQFGIVAAQRFASQSDLELSRDLATRYGPAILVLARALPVLAEASVLALGVMGLSWRRFWPPVLLSNFGLALGYAAFGAWAREREAVFAALVASVAAPVLALLVARLLLRGRQATS